MNPQIAFNVISLAITQHKNSLMKLEYDVNAGAAVTVYVQLHDFPTAADLIAGRTAPADGSVPIKSWPTPAGATNGYKEFKNGELTFSNGVFAVVSTTQATLTIGTGNNKFDSIAGEAWDSEITGTTRTQIGATNGGFGIWTNTAPHSVNRLMRLVAKQTSGADVFLMLFAHAPSAGETPLRQWTAADGATIDASFGISWDQSTGGLSLMQQDSSLVNYTGCFAEWSSTATVYTTVSPTYTAFYEYKSI